MPGRSRVGGCARFYSVGDDQQPRLARRRRGGVVGWIWLEAARFERDSAKEENDMIHGGCPCVAVAFESNVDLPQNPEARVVVPDAER